MGIIDMATINSWETKEGKSNLNFLRWVALVGMMLDHAGSVLLNGSFYDTFFGFLGITQPLIAFSIAWGVKYTKSWEKYLLRVFILALLSEIPFQFSGLNMKGGYWLNEIFALCLGILSVKAEDHYKGSGLIFVVLSYFLPLSTVLCLLCWLARVLRSDDNSVYFLAVCGVSVFVSMYGDFTLISWIFAGAIIFITPYLSLPKLGRSKLVLYTVYPLHLIILGVLKNAGISS